MTLFFSLLLGTFVSEDAACLAAGLLIGRGAISAPLAVMACACGIAIGDIGLWGLGRISGTAARRWAPFAGALEQQRVERIRTWLDRRAPLAIVGSRFLPGTRLTMTLGAGVLGVPGRVFVRWTAVGAALWTPLPVLGAAIAGERAVHLATSLLGPAGALPAAGVLMLSAASAVRVVAEPCRRRRVAATLQRWSRWEFWPMPVFYAPVVVHVAMLALRYRGVSTITAANPGMPDGGTVGESKSQILSQLPPEVTIPFAAIPPDDERNRCAALARIVRERGWSYPIIMKPDVGQRGAGVKLIGSTEAAAAYLRAQAGRVVVQPYHPGPYEAGVFYYRMPSWRRGRILAITDKQFPRVVGDGVSTLASLIWRHPRFTLQADMFLARHRKQADRIPAAGEIVTLGVAGNHAQGALFRDGRHLLTPELSRRIDAIARAVPGFYVGRFDIRYSDVDAFKAGEDLAIVELNGATSEVTSIYDPANSLIAAYRMLFRQWGIVFAIGAANRARGVVPTPTSRLLALIREHLTSRTAFAVSD